MAEQTLCNGRQQPVKPPVSAIHGLRSWDSGNRKDLASVDAVNLSADVSVGKEAGNTAAANADYTSTALLKVKMGGHAGADLVMFPLSQYVTRIQNSNAPHGIGI